MVFENWIRCESTRVSWLQDTFLLLKGGAQTYRSLQILVFLSLVVSTIYYHGRPKIELGQRLHPFWSVLISSQPVDLTETFSQVSKSMALLLKLYLILTCLLFSWLFYPQ